MFYDHTLRATSSQPRGLWTSLQKEKRVATPTRVGIAPACLVCRRGETQNRIPFMSISDMDQIHIGYGSYLDSGTFGVEMLL